MSTGERGPLLGIDIGGTAVKLAWIEPHGPPALATSDRYIRPDRAALRAALREAAGRLDRPVASATSIGLCVPGLLAEAGDCIGIAVNLPGLVGWRFDELAEEIGASVAVQRINDALAAVYDWSVLHASAGSVLGIAMGTGVGAAMLRDGVPVRIVDEGIGHIGQVDVTVGPADDAPIAPDGGRGGLEAYVGASAVVAAGGIDAAFAPGTVGCEAIARAIRICHAMLRPDVIVLLGGIGSRLRGAPHIESLVRQDLTSLARPGWRLEWGDDDHHAARGAARLAAERTPPTDHSL
ncbi:MAG: ROK family protein [Phycisphaerales bacterium]